MLRAILTNGSENTTINGPRTLNRIDGKYTLGKNMIPSCTFDIYPDNSGYKLLQPYISIIHIYDVDGNIKFGGRIISVVPKMASDGIMCKSVTCEGFLGYLNDSIFFHTDTNERTRQKWLQVFLENHNNMVGDEKAISLKNFYTENAVTGYEYNLERTTFGTITTEDMLSTGYTYEIEENNDGSLVLECFHNGNVSDTVINLGKNLESITIQDNFDNLCTRVIPLTEDGQYGLTDSAKPYVDSASGISKFGVIMKTHKFEGISDRKYLSAAAEEWLKWHSVINLTVTLNTVDLYRLGLTPEAFKLYDTYMVKCNPLNFDSGLQLTQITRDINDEWNVQLTFGDLLYRMSQYKTK